MLDLGLDLDFVSLNLSTDGDKDVQRPNRKNDGDLHRRHGRKKQAVTDSSGRFARNISNPLAA